MISYEEAKYSFEENQSNRKFIAKTKMMMAKTAKSCEQLRVAARIDELLVDQLNDAHLNSLDNIMKSINRLIPLIFHNKSRRVLLILAMKNGLEHTHHVITAMGKSVSVFIMDLSYR